MQSTEQILASTPGSSQLPASSQTPSRVLVVEPHPTLRTVLVQRLRQDGHLAAAEVQLLTLLTYAENNHLTY